jgi:hypothetical protein
MVTITNLESLLVTFSKHSVVKIVSDGNSRTIHFIDNTIENFEMSEEHFGTVISNLAKN